VNNPIVGPSYTLNTRKADVQRSVNLLPVMQEAAGGKGVAFMEAIPGLVVFSDIPEEVEE